MKVLCTAFLSLQFVFVIFLKNNISAKAARKMLMILTTGVILPIQQFMSSFYASKKVVIKESF